MGLIDRARIAAYKPAKGDTTKPKPVVAATISVGTILAIAGFVVNSGVKIATLIRDWRKKREPPIKPVPYEKETDR